jgi:hypothetical protein
LIGFQQAISLDPNYALVYVGLADAYAVSSGYGAFETKEAAQLAEAAAKGTLELAPNLGTAHAAMGSVNAEHRDWAGPTGSFSWQSPSIRRMRRATIFTVIPC